MDKNQSHSKRSNKTDELELNQNKQNQYCNDVSEDSDHSAILNNIQELAKISIDSQYLTWNALMNLRKKENRLRQEMEEQIEKLKDKYELIKQSIFNKISFVTLGIKSVKDFEQLADLEIKYPKMIPQQIKDYWAIVFLKSGLISQECDIECLQQLDSFSCNLQNVRDNHLNIQFCFKGKLKYLTNRQLTLGVKRETKNSSSMRTIKKKIQYRDNKNENSIFTYLFDPEIDKQLCIDTAYEVYRIFTNSLYFYLSKDDISDSVALCEEYSCLPNKKVKTENESGDQSRQ